MRPGRTVLVEGESIVKIGPQADVRPAPGSRVVDGSGLFLMPGLIDAHVHYVDPEHVRPAAHRERRRARPRDGQRDRTRRSTCASVCTKRELLGPEMVVTGAIIDGDPPVWPFSEKCKTAEDGRAAARKLAAAGVDQLKVYSAAATRGVLRDPRRGEEAREEGGRSRAHRP